MPSKSEGVSSDVAGTREIRCDDDVWLELTDAEVGYHLRQYDEPYRSTVAFGRFMEESALLERRGRYRMLDLGCGAGANVYWLSRVFIESTVVGVDLCEHLVGIAASRQEADPRVRFDVGDYRRPETIPSCDVVISLQRISWLAMEESEAFLRAACRSAERGVILSSLFSTCDVDYQIAVHEHHANRIVNYNVLSIPRLERVAEDAGFKLRAVAPFHIDIDLEKPDGGLGTYTVNTTDGTRMQFSGSMHQPWYFLYFERSRPTQDPGSE